VWEDGGCEAPSYPFGETVVSFVVHSGDQGNHAGQSDVFGPSPPPGLATSLRTTLLVNQVEGLQPELYWFLAGKHQLVKLKVEPGIADQITQACFNQEFVCKKRCHIHLDRRHVSHDVALRAAWVPVHALGCRARLPEPVSGRRVDRRGLLCDRRFYRRSHE